MHLISLDQKEAILLAGVSSPAPEHITAGGFEHCVSGAIISTTSTSDGRNVSLAIRQPVSTSVGGGNDINVHNYEENHRLCVHSLFWLPV